jgi:uncharacterized protein
MKTISVRAKTLSSFLSKIKGLMFEREIKPVYMETRLGIHTFFVRYPIDIVVLGEDNIVKTIKNSLKPWKVYFWKPKYFRILELPTGFIKRSSIKIGSKIELNLTD